MDVHLDLPATGPLRACLEQQLRDGVRSGRLRVGTRLPPSRALARDLGVSRGVVVNAYAQLVAEGYLTARRGAGTTVAAQPVDASPAASSTARPKPVTYDLRTGRPDLSAFPRGAWHAAVGRAVRDLSDDALGYGDWRGHEPLRSALADYLGRTRGVLANADRIVVCGGLYQGLHVLWRALRRHGARRVAVEDPGWRGQRRSVQYAGLELVPVPVDERGLEVEALEASDADAVVLSPAHQYPTGVVLAPERRAQLVGWAHERRALVVEDDYDAEYRYDRAPVGCLQGLAPDVVVYGGSASKMLAPALRLGWLLVPPRLAAGFAGGKSAADHGSPVLDQLAFADLLDSGALDRHLRRTRSDYRARRDDLVAALARHLPDSTVRGIAAGLHAVVELDGGADEHAIEAHATKLGVAVHGMHRYRVASTGPPAFAIGYSRLPARCIDAGIARLAVAVARSRADG